MLLYSHPKEFSINYETKVVDHGFWTSLSLPSYYLKLYFRNRIYFYWMEFRCRSCQIFENDFFAKTLLVRLPIIVVVRPDRFIFIIKEIIIDCRNYVRCNLEPLSSMKAHFHPHLGYAHISTISLTRWNRSESVYSPFQPIQFNHFFSYTAHQSIEQVINVNHY